MRVEAKGVDELSAVLARARQLAGTEAEKITGKALDNIKRGAARRVRGYAHLPHLPRSFTYDVWLSGTTVHGQASADRGRAQGGLDSYIEDGTINNAPISHWAPALDDEYPTWVRYLEESGVNLLES